MKAFKAFLKPFETPQRSGKIKIKVNFFSSARKVKAYLGPLIKPLLHIFNSTLATGIFLDSLKNARTPITSRTRKLQTNLSSAMFFQNPRKNNVQ